jgi:hypothetical protein
LIKDIEKNGEICFKHFPKGPKKWKVLNKHIDGFKIKKTINLEIDYYNNKITI